MAWIESHQTLEKNGKLLELANKLGINKYQAIGHLHALWWWAIDNAEDGNLKRFCNDTLEEVCGWTRYVQDECDMARLNEITNKDGSGKLIPSLISCGFLDEKDDGIWIHNWSEYTHRYFQSIRQKELTKLRVQEYRKKCNANVTQEKRTGNAPTIPYLTIPNHKKIEEAPSRINIQRPTAEEVSAYAKSINFSLDGAYFVDYQDTRGWKLKGGQPVKDWRACVRTWKKNNFGTGGVVEKKEKIIL